MEIATLQDESRVLGTKISNDISVERKDIRMQSVDSSILPALQLETKTTSNALKITNFNKVIENKTSSKRSNSTK